METVQWKREEIQKREWNLNLGCLGFSKLHKDPSKYSFKPNVVRHTKRRNSATHRLCNQFKNVAHTRANINWQYL